MTAELYAEFENIFPFKSVRFIPYAAYSGLQNMCVDYYLAHACVESHEPVVRFYGWNPFCLSLGKHQNARDVASDNLFGAGFDLVRRPTGGSAIFHSEELTYSFSVPGTRLDHQGLYRFFHILLKSALQQCGISVSLEDTTSGYRLNRGGDTFACFNRTAFSELKCDGKKVVGSAQKIFPESLLQHGSIMLGKGHLRLTDFLDLEEPLRKRYKEQMNTKAIDLNTISDRRISPVDIMKTFLRELSENTGLITRIQDLREEELSKSMQWQNHFKTGL